MVELNDVAAPLNKEGVDAEPSNDADDELKSEAWGEAPDDPNKEDTGAEDVGVAKREDDEKEEDATVEGVLKRENPLPEEADAGAADACGTMDAPGVAELANNPATWVEGCEFAGKFKVGCTLLAAASCFAVSRRSASRNGSFTSPRRR